MTYEKSLQKQLYLLHKIVIQPPPSKKNQKKEKKQLQFAHAS